jgi:hypothetical protein
MMLTTSSSNPPFRKNTTGVWITPDTRYFFGLSFPEGICVYRSMYGDAPALHLNGTAILLEELMKRYGMNGCSAA